MRMGDVDMHGIKKWLLPAMIAAGLSACQTADLATAAKVDAGSITASTGGGLDATRKEKAAGGEDLQLGKEHFRNANYGLAEKHFRQAVEQSQDSVEALIGLAAAYDQLGRFDLADRAYQEAIKMAGPTSAILNNRGYSYFLRRDFKRARADFQQALRKDPENAMARKNMELLNRRG
jgi:Flp pilus assembly protein TadD